MKIGYARVSSNSQDLELQKQALLNAGCKKILSETVSGKDNNRHKLLELLESLRAGDIVIVYKRLDQLRLVSATKYAPGNSTAQPA